MDNIFIQAVCLQPPIILARQLLPFSLWHNYILKGIKSPFAIGGAPDIDDVALAVWICSHTYDEGSKILFGSIGSVKQDLINWGSARVNKKPDVPSLVSDIEEYINSYLEIPEHWQESSPGQSSKLLRGPWEWHCVLNLCSNHLSANRSDAWNMSVSEARCWYSIYAASQGDETLITESDVQDIEKASKKKAGAPNG